MKQSPYTETLKAIPEEWTDLKSLPTTIPPHSAAPMSTLLECLERDGKIQTRVVYDSGAPRLQVRRAKS